jgi:hypothetical protein
MRALLSRACIAVCVFVLALSRAQAGAFLFPEGAGQLIVTTTFADARKAYGPSGRLISTPSYRKFETQAYVEYGATDWLTVVAEGSHFSFHGAGSPTSHLELVTEEAKAGAPLTLSEPPGPRYAGLGLGALGARVRLYEIGGFIISVEGSFRCASPSARQYLDMKDGRQIDARVLVGRPLEIFGMRGFVDAQMGYRTRGQNGGEVRADFTYGLRPLEDVLLLAQSFMAVSPGGMTATTFIASQKFEASVVYDITRDFSIQVGAIAALAGTNSPAERGVVTGGWVRF